MKLTADSKGRLISADLFRPGTAFNVERREDGSIRMVELTRKAVPIVRPRRINGRLRGADVKLSRETIAAAIRADRDSR